MEEVQVDGSLHSVVLALDFNIGESPAMPTLADLRLRVTGPALLEQVGLGEAALAAEKTLTRSPSTGRPYQDLGDDVLQFLLMSSGNTNAIGSGRWLFFKFIIGDTAREGPVQVAVVKREQTFAPPAADSLLWSQDYDTPVVIWPEVRNED